MNKHISGGEPAGRWTFPCVEPGGARNSDTQQQVRSFFSTAPRADADSLYYRPYRPSTGRWPWPCMAHRQLAALSPRAHAALSGDNVVTARPPRARHPADRIGRRRPSLHARTHARAVVAGGPRVSSTCPRPSARRHYCVALPIDRSTHGPVPADTDCTDGSSHAARPHAADGQTDFPRTGHRCNGTVHRRYATYS